MFTGPEEVERQRDRIRAVTFDGSSTDVNREFLHGSSCTFPCQKLSEGLPFDGSLDSCNAVLSLLSLSSSWLMVSFFQESLTCCRSSERPGHIVLTSQLAKREIFLRGSMTSGHPQERQTLADRHRIFGGLLSLRLVVVGQ